MIERLKSLAVFAEVVRTGQFRAAAERLKMTPSAISYHIRTLEEAVGAPLLYRSTRKFTLTASGANLFAAAEQMLNAAQAGFSEAQQSQATLSGQLKVTLTTALSHSYFSERIARFVMDYPQVDLDLHFDNRETDLVAEGMDVAIRIGDLRDSSLLCRLLWDMPRILVASPDFVEKHGPFATPEDLTSAPWIRFSRIDNHRVFHTPDCAKVKVAQTGNLTVNSIEAMVDLTCNGAGISSPPTHFVEAQIASGALTTCLPDHRMDTLPVYAIWHRTIVPNLLVKVFIDYLSRKLPDGFAPQSEEPSTSDA